MHYLEIITNAADILMWCALAVGIVVTLFSYALEALAAKVSAGFWNLFFSHTCDAFYFISRIVWRFVVACAVINIFVFILIYIHGRIYG